MTDTIRNASDRNLRYRSPEEKVIFVKAHGILCYSDGNDSMSETDYGNGGFGEL